mmetsp:Transcript_6677/g.5939  ORF Transcript_6677/g.5939 Transcript_6677/m.5939 type:complete len:294 (-) Transcript_6677:251-1132(-)
MLYLLSLLLITIILTNGSGDHAGHSHSDETIADCECTTGITTSELDTNCDDADFQSNLVALESYLTDNSCEQYCEDFALTEETEAAFTCYQVFSLLVQYHDYCPSGTVDEEMFHEYLEVCPDCYQNHHQYPGAVSCDADLNCTDSEHQEEDVAYVLEYCITECPDEDQGDVVSTNADTDGHDDHDEHGTCEEVWQHVEGYHRMCAHTDLSEDFDELYDQAVDAFSTTVCQDIHCNVPWEYNNTATCTSSENTKYNTLRGTYGDLVIADIVDGANQKSIITLLTTIIIIATVFV